MSSSPRIRVLIAEDHPAIREGLAALLGYEPDMQVVGQACHGFEAIDLYRSHRPDVLLTDLEMPHMDGIAATRILIAEFPTARIIVWTETADHRFPEAKSAGAAHCLLKDISYTVLFSIIRTVCGSRQL